MTRLEASWLTDPASVAVMDALWEGYFVGGCVRNALLGAGVTDLDIATPHPPEESVRLLEAAGLKAVPTGLSHGTITAVHEGTPIEVTTFRADVATDGRHAEVAFTTDMATDAARRDFTMNALYADREGQVVDPLGGLPDLEARRVRFIACAEDRIREDYLRILRFFRFHAWYGAEGIDADGLAACAELADGLDGLARERVGWEFRKLLAAPDPAPAMASMASAAVLMRCLPGADPMALAPLVHLEQQAGIAPDWPTRLAAIGGEDPTSRLRLSKAETLEQATIRKALDLQDRPVAEIAYRAGAMAAHRAALVVAASVGGALPDRLDAEIRRGAEARFPLRAKDLLNAGYTPGPQVGTALVVQEEAWIASDFKLSRDELLSRLPPA
ncbi:MAG: CCA tRNA nucleotidyltransferase [Pseudomonadota bacterium]